MATVESPNAGLVERVQELTERLEEIADLEVRALADELAGALVKLYGEGLERIFAAVPEEIRDTLAEDGVVASLMLIHGLYPVDLETRVAEALDSVRPYLESHGGNVELVALDDGVARLRLQGSCNGCAASASTLELAIEQALEDNAPDLLGLEVAGVVERPPVRMSRAAAGDRTWVTLEGAAELARGATMAAGDGLFVANVAGTLLAYRNACTGCGAPLDTGVLIGGGLVCGGCERRFDLPRAGRCAEEDGIQLEPVPLLREQGVVRVALAP